MEHRALSVGFIMLAALGVSSPAAGQCFETELHASDASRTDQFGWAVALKGDVLAVAAPSRGRQNQYGGYPGAVYLFRKVDGEWVEEQTIEPEDAAFGARALAFASGQLLIGVPYDSDLLGAVFAYEFDGSEWVQRQRIVPSDVHTIEFGWSIAARGDLAVIGAPDASPQDGTVFVFRFDGTEWQEEAALDSNTLEFGRSVDTDGERVIASAWSTGPARIYRQDGGVWSEEDALEIGSEIGLAIRGDIALIGDPSDDQNGESAGAVHVFHFDGASWQPAAVIRPDDNAALDRFGWAIDLRGDTAVITAPQQPLVGQSDLLGKAYIFRLTDATGSAWEEVGTLTAPDGESNDGFGFGDRPIAFDSDHIVIGAHLTDDAPPQNTGTDSGSVYIFDWCEAELRGFSIAAGTLLGGDLDSVGESDDENLRVQSRFEFGGNNPHLVDIRFRSVTDNMDATEIDLALEGRLNHAGGSGRLRLRDWTTTDFERVHEFPIGTTETTESVFGLDAANFIHPGDGRIHLSYRVSIMAIFGVDGFRALTDHLIIRAR